MALARAVLCRSLCKRQSVSERRYGRKIPDGWLIGCQTSQVKYGTRGKPARTRTCVTRLTATTSSSPSRSVTTTRPASAHRHPHKESTHKDSSTTMHTRTEIHQDGFTARTNTNILKIVTGGGGWMERERGPSQQRGDTCSSHLIHVKIHNEGSKQQQEQERERGGVRGRG